MKLVLMHANMSFVNEDLNRNAWQWAVFAERLGGTMRKAPMRRPALTPVVPCGYLSPRPSAPEWSEIETINVNMPVTMSPTIRPAETRDLNPCAGILAEAYRGLVASDGWDGAMVEALVKSQANHDHLALLLAQEQLLIAIQQAVVVGFVSVREDEVTFLYVHAQHRRQHIGSRLMAAAERVIRSAGHPRLVVHVAAASALPFYQAAGMKAISELVIEQGPCAGRTAKRLEKALR